MKDNEKSKISLDNIPLGFIILGIGTIWFAYYVLNMKKE